MRNGVNKFLESLENSSFFSKYKIEKKKRIIAKLSSGSLSKSINRGRRIGWKKEKKEGRIQGGGIHLEISIGRDGAERLRGWKSNYWTLSFLPFPLFRAPRVSCNRGDTTTVSFLLSPPVRRSFLFVASGLDSLPDPTRREANYRGIKEQFPSSGQLVAECLRHGKWAKDRQSRKNLQGRTVIFPFSQTDAARICLESFPVTVRLNRLPLPKGFRNLSKYRQQWPTMVSSRILLAACKNNIEKKGRKKIK